jgi:hypothetical protein
MSNIIKHSRSISNMRLMYYETIFEDVSIDINIKS